jgi:hypothetical protein
MNCLTTFTWGYWGWGNSTPYFVQLLDAVENARGFAPPLFVDTRISRAVRAKGFSGNSFCDLLGNARYRHMAALGNLAVLGHPGPPIQFKDSTQVPVLLRLVQELAQANRRVLFFCACEFPRTEGQKNACHQVTLARLLLEAAQERGVPIEVVEWPGGEPQLLDVELPPDVARKLLHGGRPIPFGLSTPPARFASLPWGSIIRVRSAIGDFGAAVGPARYGRASINHAPHPSCWGKPSASW